jgi:hypothetical protein
MTNVKLQNKLYSYLNETNYTIQVFLAPEDSRHYNLKDAFVLRCTGCHTLNLTHILDLASDTCMVFRGGVPLLNCTEKLHQSIWQESASWHQYTYENSNPEDRKYFKIIKH